jgi:hypothetical protein
MMKHEFEQIAGYEVSWEDYNTIIEPMYLAIPENISKQDFVKMISRKRFEVKRPTEIVIIGVKQMPNGTWMNYEAELVDVDIKTGKIKVKRITENRCWAETDYDIHYTRVVEV